MTSSPFGSSGKTDNLQELQRKVPVVGDKALIDLVNGIQISGDLIRYRKSRGFFGQLLDSLTGGDRQRQLLLDGNLIAGQQALSDWVLELSDSLRVSQVALEVTQTSLLEARTAIRSQKKELLTLEQTFNQLAQQIGLRVDNLDARVRKLEIQIAAKQDFDQIVTAWEARQTYAEFSWAIQIALLIREVFSSSVVLYELETGNKTQFRQLLINKVLAESKDISGSFFGLADLLNTSHAEMKGDYAKLALGLLETRSFSQKRLQNIPYLFTLGTTLELAELPEDVKPAKPAQCAIELCRSQISSIDYTTDAKEFVTRLVEETANDCLTIATRRLSYDS
ncbi:hypothetical protein H6G89_33835 [Oscillatoria sp. FACHB-1407]|uniref:diguanylate cyclase regulator RdcB family protein n=1 Tax=Oscillatoria sp. FACHB-1407 TaxID=2692847 RepID=UPI0016844A80|nr:diguanylate cyclase regulator RdcB family protein [Oscillatoria sp. FACHB-1407]MBD2465968.1 hypothetical protein [Oscillatoria sp. FACHB-1407]